MSDTPRTDEQINGKPCTRFAIMAGDSLRDAHVSAEFARTLERENAELAILVRRLVREVRKFMPGNELGVKAMDYLKRVNLDGKTLRDIQKL